MKRTCKCLMVLGLLTVAACSQAGATPRSTEPYGVWTSERGQVIVVWRNGKYEFCGEEICQEGTYTRQGFTHVRLQGFGQLKANQTLRSISGWDELRKVMPHRDDSYDLGDGGMDDSYRHTLCQDRPCSPVGKLDDPEVFRFVKVEDF